MAKDKIRMGIIGVGWWAVGVHWKHLSADDRVKVATICRRNEDLLAKAASIMGVERTYTDWQEMLKTEELDAVIVSTPTNYHAEPTIAALEKGLNVLVEKPMALSTADAQAMIDAAHASSGRLMVGYKYRCSPLWRAASEAIHAGEIGTVRQISAVAFGANRLFTDLTAAPESWRESLNKEDPIQPFKADISREGNWRGDPAQSGGSMFVDMHTHTVDLMFWMAGARPRTVSCILARDESPVELAIATQATLDNGVLFSFSYNSDVLADPKNGGGMTHITVTGDEGAMHIAEGLFGPGKTQVEIISGGEIRQVTAEGSSGGPAGMFIDFITGKIDNPAPPEEAIWTVALTEASYQSAREQKVITLS